MICRVLKDHFRSLQTPFKLLKNLKYRYKPHTEEMSDNECLEIILEEGEQGDLGFVKTETISNDVDDDELGN